MDMGSICQSLSQPDWNYWYMSNVEAGAVDKDFIRDHTAIIVFVKSEDGIECAKLTHDGIHYFYHNTTSKFPSDLIEQYGGWRYTIFIEPGCFSEFDYHEICPYSQIPFQFITQKSYGLGYIALNSDVLWPLSHPNFDVFTRISALTRQALCTAVTNYKFWGNDFACSECRAKDRAEFCAGTAVVCWLISLRQLMLAIHGVNSFPQSFSIFPPVFYQMWFLFVETGYWSNLEFIAIQSTTSDDCFTSVPVEPSYLDCLVSSE